MKSNWSKSDVHALKVILEKAKKNAEQMTLEKFKNYKVQTVSDMWELELILRKWRKDLEELSSFQYDSVGQDIKKYLKNGWLSNKDISSLTEERKRKLNLYDNK